MSPGTTKSAGDAVGESLQGETLARADTIDVTAWVAVGFAAAGLIPKRAFGSALSVEAFGPLALPAILAMVGMLFGLITLLRFAERGEVRSRDLAVSGIAVAVVRLFVYPWLGW